jgi:hypothetical protein
MDFSRELLANFPLPIFHNWKLTGSEGTLFKAARWVRAAQRSEARRRALIGRPRLVPSQGQAEVTYQIANERRRSSERPDRSQVKTYAQDTARIRNAKRRVATSRRNTLHKMLLELATGRDNCGDWDCLCDWSTSCLIGVDRDRQVEGFQLLVCESRVSDLQS